MKKTSLTLFLAVLTLGAPHLAVAAWPSEAPLVTLKGGESAAQLQQAYQSALQSVVSDFNGKNNNKALKKLEATIHHASRPGAETERAACFRALAGILQSDIPTDAKVWILKLSVFSAKAEMVPVMASLLKEKDTLVRESARCALEGNPASEATTALRSALSDATDFKPAIILSLGARKDTGSVVLITPFLKNTEPALLDATLYALGNIASPEADQALAKASVPDPFKLSLAEARIKCAEQLAVSGNTSKATEIYAVLDSASQPRSIRLAALRGALKNSGQKTSDKIIEILKGTDSDAQSIALGLVPDLTPSEIQGIGGSLAQLPLSTKVQLITMIADLGNPSILPVAIDLAGNQDEPTRIAALSAIGRVGNASVVPLLLSAMKSQGNTAGTAKNAMTRISGADVNEKITEALRKETDASACGNLIDILEQRSASIAVPALFEKAASTDANLRRKAIRALGRLAQTSDIPALSQCLFKSTPGAEREECERAMATVCSHTPDLKNQADPLLAVYGKATPREQLLLLPALGRLGGSRALDVVKTALASTDAATYEAGVNAISNWPDADTDAEEQLLALVKKTEKKNERSAAVRAYIRLISQPSGLPEQERLRKLQKGMELAENDNDRNFVLERISEIHRIEALRFVLPYLDKPANMNRACNTVLDMARDRPFRAQHKAEFDAALDKVILVCKDNALLERAQRYRKGN